MNESRKYKSVVIAGYYGYGNAGDELILKSLIQQLKEKNPNIQITVMSLRPRETEQSFGVQSINRWRPWEWIKPLWKAERFILGGGGLLQEATGPFNYLYYLSLLMIAKCFGCRTEVHAMGVDPVDHVWNRLWALFVFNSWVDYVSVRDEESQRALESIGVLRRIWRVPDLIFRMDVPTTQTVKDAQRIALAITEWPQRPGWEHDVAFLLERIKNELQVELDLWVFYPDQDTRLAQQIADLTGHKVSVRIASNPVDVLSWISDYGLIVGMRYHALALAALGGRPFIGWGFQRKVRTLCRDFNQQMWTFERGWDSEIVFRQICEAWKRREALPERYRDYLKRLVNAAPVASESARIFVAQV